MKLLRKILAVCIIATGATGCLKDSSMMDPSNTHNVVEFMNTEGITSSQLSTYPLYTINKTFAAPSDTYNAVVHYTGADNAPQDITVTVELGTQAVIDKYNKDNTKTFVMIPSTLYSFPATVTIPKGQRTVNLPISLPNTAVLKGNKYVLPLTIKSASYGIISGNFATILYAF